MGSPQVFSCKTSQRGRGDRQEWRFRVTHSNDIGTHPPHNIFGKGVAKHCCGVVENLLSGLLDKLSNDTNYTNNDYSNNNTI